MKKHRNFLLYYCLWLTMIFTMLTIFNTSEEKNFPITKRSIICEANSYSMKHKESNKCSNRWCCKSKEERTAQRLQ